MTFRLHRNRNGGEINPFANNNARFVEDNELIAVGLNRIREFDKAFSHVLNRLADIEAGVFNDGIPPINRAVKFEEFIVRAPDVVIYRLETEIVEVTGKSSLDERVIIESNKNYRFFTPS